MESQLDWELNAKRVELRIERNLPTAHGNIKKVTWESSRSTHLHFLSPDAAGSSLWIPSLTPDLLNEKIQGSKFEDRIGFLKQFMN